MKLISAQPYSRWPWLPLIILNHALLQVSLAAELRWEKLPPLPKPLGVAGAFAGVTEGALLVAGGANFPDKMPWAGGQKVWHDEVFILEKQDAQWRRGGHLPLPLAYGVSVTHPRGIVCVGGSDALQHHVSVLMLRLVSGRLVSEPLPALPGPRANLCGALLGDTLFIAGGTATPDATNALQDFSSMNLGSTQPAWHMLPSWPGSPRMLATAGAHDGSFYLFGGAALHAGPDGKPVRQWLRDAYRYTPGQGWKRLANLPRVAVAAPSPAPVVNGWLLIIGGDDGSQINTLPTAHEGFRRDVLAYDPETDRWEQLTNTPFAQVTTATAQWGDRIVIPSGEIRPGVRSPEVWSLTTR